MTETIEPMAARIDQLQLAQQLVEQARAEGVELVGPGGLLTGLTKTVLETALEAEMTEHLGYDKHDPRAATARTPATAPGPRRCSPRSARCRSRCRATGTRSFEPAIVRKRQRRLDGIDEIVLSLTARGLTTGEIAAHFAEVYGATVSKDTISRITDKVVEEMAEWRDRPLDPVYPVLFIDAIVVKVRDGQVVNRPVYVVIGVTVDGERDILGLWAGDGGEGAKFWLQVLTEIKNRGVEDVCIAVCDGLKGLPDAITTVWPQAIVQACIIHLIRNTFRYACRRDWERWPRTCGRSTPPRPSRGRRAGSPSSPSAGASTRRSSRSGATAWAEFIPFLDYDVEIRRVICSTNAIESLNARYRRAVRARGHFPTEQAALKCLYLVTRSLDPTGSGRARWAMRWKPALNAFAITFEGRIVPSTTN